jgi:GNAT superfamily N-acetyltransferase
MPESEIRESNEQYIASAAMFCTNFPWAEVVELPGLVAEWCNTALPFCNTIFLTKPVIDLADLRSRVAALAGYLARKEKPPLLCVCEKWIPEALRSDAGSLLGEIGLQAAMTITGMAASELPPPARTSSVLEFRRADTEETRTHLADVNAAAYGLPVEPLREALALPDIWTDEFAGYVAYAEGRPIAAAGAMALRGCLHVMCVATIPECRRRGYAEAVIRHALEEMSGATGFSRTSLHATEAGLPAYLRMGYRETAKFIAYTRG